MKAALVVIFNHRYEKNIPKLEEYYAERFSHRSYLVPFAPAESERVLRVIENGWCFSGHIAQAVERFKAHEVSHYVFAGDDLILHPNLNETSILDALQLDVSTAYIKSLSSADGVRYSWPWSMYAYNSLPNAKFDYRKELPAGNDALLRFEKLGIRFRKPRPRTKADLKWLEFPARPKSLREAYWALKLVRPYLVSLSQFVASFGKTSDFPLLAGYADLIVVPAEHIDSFAHYCGVFAAMNMFAEVAVPTALALSCDKIRTELLMGDHFADPGARVAPETRRRGLELWGKQIPAFGNSLKFSWSALMEQFPNEALYYHPIKLSQWK